MKRLISLTMSICLLASSALAAAPEETLKLLILGNQKYVLENALDNDAVVTILADPSIKTDPATLFGVSEARLNVITAGNALPTDADAVTPVIIVLGTDETAVWDAYAGALQKSPALIRAVLNGRTSVLGAMLNADGAVTILGPHPDLLVMAGQYILDKPIQGGTPEKVGPAPAKSGETDQTPAESGESDQAPAEKTDHTDVQKSENHGSSSMQTIEFTHQVEKSDDSSVLPGMFLSVAAIIGIVIALDKTILRA